MAAGRVLLRNAFSPLRYVLALEPDLQRFTFDGNVSIIGRVATSTSSITLHSKELSIASASFATAEKKMVNASQIKHNLTDNTVEFVFPESLPVGEGTLSIPYVGVLNNQMAGFYRSHYTDASGVKRVMGSTQFEPLDCRRAMPCVDEPAEKAVFSVTMTIPAQLMAFSNMPELESTLLANGKKRIKFMDSPKMSSYLLAFCVGEFDFVQRLSEHGVLIRVYTPPGKAEQGLFALDCAYKSLDYFDDFFGSPYPLPKLDMVAIPEFAMGAMENWGLVTYREVDLLIDPAKASPQQRERVCTVVAHELAHQWFGNLVTMAWWDDLWLNEGFATFMQNLATAHIFPDWAMWEQFGADILAGALGLDALRSSHPIQVPIKRAEEVEEVFDAISYLKGASVNRMLHTVLGGDAFKQGLQLYMQRHKYGNTETTDLWTALGEASKRDVRALMTSWTEQMGYPLVTVTDVVTVGDTTTLKLSQQWFLADGSQGDGRLWTIPMVVAVAGGSAQPAQIPFYSDKSFEVTVPSTTGWIKLNADQTIPMRVAYTPALLTRLAAGIRDKSLPAADRAGVLLDAYALAKAGHYDPAVIIELLAAYANEDNATVWGALAAVLVGLDKILMGSGHAMYAPFAELAAALTAPAIARVGWASTPSDGHRSKILRATMIGLAGRFSKDPATVTAARARFAAIVAAPTDPASCPSEYKATVYHVALKHGGVTEYEQLMGLYATLQDNAERKQIMLSLGATTDPALRARTLAWATSGEVKLQDFFYPMMSLAASSPAGLETMWTYFQDNFARLRAMLNSASPSLFDAVIGAACAGFATTARADEVAKFFADHPLPANQRRISQILEGIRVNAAFMDRMAASRMGSPDFWAAAKL